MFRNIQVMPLKVYEQRSGFTT